MGTMILVWTFLLGLASSPLAWACLLAGAVVVRIWLALPAHPPRRGVRNFDAHDPYAYDEHNVTDLF